MKPNTSQFQTNTTEKAGCLITKHELATFLQVTTRTVEFMQTRGLPFYKVGARRNRYDKDAVVAWLAQKGGAA